MIGVGGGGACWGLLGELDTAPGSGFVASCLKTLREYLHEVKILSEKLDGVKLFWKGANRRYQRCFLVLCVISSCVVISGNLHSQGGQPGEAQYTMGDNLPEADCLPEYNMDTNAPKPEPVYLKREKESPPSLHPPKHPHGVQPPASVHPHTGQARPLTYGNDNSSVNRQSRGQSTRPDPIPGAPYAGASAQRMGSALLRKSNASGAIANRASEDSRATTTSRPPSSFQKPQARFNTGLAQIQSQHNIDYQPPMPRPPLFSTW